MHVISPLTSSDMPNIHLLQPEGWNDIRPHIEFYVNSAFCFPLKVALNNTLIGIGTTILHENTAWLAHIIVHPENRNQGVGKMITETLVNSLRNTRYSTLFLIATKLGEPVYRKVGFEPETEYIFFQNSQVELTSSVTLTAFDEKFKEGILKLDSIVSGENRKTLLSQHFANAALAIQGNEVTGFFLPTLGEGLIIAACEEAGLALLGKRKTPNMRVALPIENKQAIDFLTHHGAQEYSRGTRMRLGKKIQWQPEKIYSRIGGNLG